jgi:hypothetical protein
MWSQRGIIRKVPDREVLTAQTKLKRDSFYVRVSAGNSIYETLHLDESISNTRAFQHFCRCEHTSRFSSAAALVLLALDDSAVSFKSGPDFHPLGIAVLPRCCIDFPSGPIALLTGVIFPSE